MNKYFLKTWRLGVTPCLVIFALMLSTVNSFAAATTVKSAISDEDRQRQQKVEVADKLFKKAKKLAVSKKYLEAQQLCEAALKEIDSMPGPFVDLQKQRINAYIVNLILQRVGELEYAARKAFLYKNYEESVSLAKEAVKIMDDETDNAENTKNLKNYTKLKNFSGSIDRSMEKLIKDCRKFISAAKYNEETSLKTIDPENESRKEDINLYLKEAEILYKNKRYEQVRDNLERVLMRDPFNEKAIFLLEKTYRKIYYVAKLRRYNEAIERLSEVEWKQTEGILPTEVIRPPESGPKVSDDTRSSLYEKMQKIIFDQVEFEDASINSVIAHLQSRSKELDPDGEGVNLILSLKSSDPEQVPRITMTFDQMPMQEVIRYLCEGTNLKYRVEENAVLIGDKDIDVMVTRFFKVRAALISRIAPADGGGGEKKEEKKDVFADEDGFDFDSDSFTDDNKKDDKKATTAGGSATAGALRDYFTARGIPFDNEDAQIAYDRRAGKLVVTNTPDNLRKFEALLRDIDIETPLVLIESKILEISDVDLEELGFAWTFSQVDSTGNTSWAPTDQILRFFMSANDPNDSFVSSSPYKLVNNLNFIPSIGDENFNVGLTVTAVDQNDRSEILSAPKVIATSGSPAIIRMVREEYYPDSWVEPEISVGEQGTITYNPTYPEFGDATDIGIRFEVTPTVSPNNYTVTLQLNPQVIALTGWTSYDYEVILGINEGQVQSTSREYIKMPNISRRDMSATVKVFDGETVILGGMLTDKKLGRDDQWPGLGEIPLLGRLFSSELDYSHKRNMLIFVSVRLINNDGVPVRENSLRGIFDFRR